MFLIHQVDLVAQGDSVYDIIDASDHLITRTNLSTSTSLETGKTERRPRIQTDISSPIVTEQLSKPGLCRSLVPLPLQHVQVSEEAEHGQQAGSDPSPGSPLPVGR